MQHETRRGDDQMLYVMFKIESSKMDPLEAECGFKV